jgi:hypothetical protein
LVLVQVNPQTRQFRHLRPLVLVRSVLSMESLLVLILLVRLPTTQHLHRTLAILRPALLVAGIKVLVSTRLLVLAPERMEPVRAVLAAVVAAVELTSL